MPGLVAGNITNREAIERLPEERRRGAAHSLETFIAAFNRSFPLLENIFECQQNPFRDSLRMSADTPISFSLPSKPSTAGVQATEGICTGACLFSVRLCIFRKSCCFCPLCGREHQSIYKQENEFVGELASQ